MTPRWMWTAFSYVTTMLAGVGFFTVCFAAGFYFGRV